MNKDDVVKLLDSLTKEQRVAIAAMIRSTDPEGDYHWNGEDSVWTESVKETLDTLAWTFEQHDPESAI